MSKAKTKGLRDYRGGEQVYYYHGDGSVFRVEILENYCGSDSTGRKDRCVPHFFGYMLKILEIIKIDQKSFCKPITEGLEFSCEKVGNISCAGSNWELSDKLK